MSRNLPYVSDRPEPREPRRSAMERSWSIPESELIPQLMRALDLGEEQRARIQDRAVELVRRVRKRSEDPGAMEAFMHEYDLSSEEGVVLMCLAEALLRIP
ncbi:MAG: hypothetical protein LC637_03550, partial [Xanthomonadaceae bacterium]|nr:hypothetical protein [Xanthomonadaceae bacterium]